MERRGNSGSVDKLEIIGQVYSRGDTSERYFGKREFWCCFIT